MKIASTLLLAVAIFGQSCMTQKDKEIYADLFLNKTQETSQEIKDSEKANDQVNRETPKENTPENVQPASLKSEDQVVPWDDYSSWEK